MSNKTRYLASLIFYTFSFLCRATLNVIEDIKNCINALESEQQMAPINVQLMDSNCAIIYQHSSTAEVSNMWHILSKWNASVQDLERRYGWKYLGVVIFFFRFWDFLCFKCNETVLDQNLKPKWYKFMISGHFDNWLHNKLQLWKPISPFHTYQYHIGQMGISSNRIVQFL